MNPTLLLAVLLLALSLPLPARSAPVEPKREGIEWIDMWVPSSDKADLPHVLLIGDSISRGYYPVVEKALAGKAYVARYATSQFLSDPFLLENLRQLLSQMKFDVIHVNNGLHGLSYGEDDYRAALPAFLAVIREGAPQAKLIWASSTPASVANHIEQIGPLTERIKARNAAAHECVAAAGIPEDDLFALAFPHPEWHVADGIHFVADGYAALGQQVAAEVAKLLPAK